jgi:signal transduction histidine kinase
MKRPPLFLAIEILIFVGAELGNALSIAPTPSSSRVVIGVLIAAFFAWGFVVPKRSSARTVALIVDGLALAAMASYTGLALALTVLLPVRCLELKPRDRGFLTASSAFALAVFALASYIGASIEHRPFAAIAAAVFVPLYTLIVLIVLQSENLRQAYVALAASNAELTLRADRWQQIAILSEHYQLGRDLQNTVGQGLEKINDELERTLREIESDAEAARAFAFHAQRTAAFTLAGLNRSISSLRDASVSQGRLVDNLRDMSQAFSGSSAFKVQADIADVPVRDPAAASALERIAREALINVARHSEAKHVKLAFRSSEGRPELLIEDDGSGFDLATAAAGAGKGLAIMRERAKSIGATCAVVSAPGRGTSVRVTLPAIS